MTPDFTELGIRIPEVLLPAPNVDLKKWAVVACDQYTAQREYWEQVSGLVGEAPSTLKIIYPEVFLGKEDPQTRIKNIHRTMRQYLENNVLVSKGPGFIYVERKISGSKSRKGLIVAIDLECYDYRKGARTLVRATEGTVLERIPPRVKIREEAPVELPHIMVLLDDPEGEVIQPLAGAKNEMELAYQTELMMNGGEIKGYQIRDSRLMNGIFQSLKKLADGERFKKRYGTADDNVLLYAVGDGNHSLATAKAVWEQLKRDKPAAVLSNHPARLAMVELVNVYDPGLCFEPIHRVVFHVNTEDILNSMTEYYRDLGGGLARQKFSSRESLLQALPEMRLHSGGSHIIEYVTKDDNGIVEIKNPLQNLEVGSLQTFLDVYADSHREVEIDYIHGDEVVTRLGSEPGNIGFYLPAMDKRELFKTVITDGALPRKTFSMGEAEEKRFYMECRKII